MDADCLRNGSLFCRFAGKGKHKNEKWINYRLLWQMRDPNGQRRGAGSVCSTERTRILVPAEQGNRVRIPDMWKGNTFLSSCVYRALFSMQEICVRWKPVIGRAVMARREGWSNAFARKRGCGLRDSRASRAWMDQSEDLQKAKPENCEHHSRRLRC